MSTRARWLFASTWLALLATSTSAQTLADLRVSGSGAFDTNCFHTLAPGCATTATGQMTGTPIDPGEFILRVDTGSPSSFNGYDTEQGLCLPAMRRGRLTEAGGDSIEFATVGMLCEEAEPGSPYHFSGSYRILSGTGRFANAAGVGRVSAAFTRQDTISGGTGTALFVLDGIITY